MDTASSLAKTLWYSFEQSDCVGKFIVIALIICSVYAWSIAIDKCHFLYVCSKSMQKFQGVFEKCRSPLSMGVRLEEYSGPLKEICLSGIDEVFKILGISGEKKRRLLEQASLPRALTDAELEKIRSTMNRTANVQSLDLDEKMGLMSVFVTTSPYLGLFGTVWGVMATFIAIARSGKIEITAIAPGISGALLTTVMGLAVAIPSVICSILMTSSINGMNQKMDIFVEDFIAGLKLEENQQEERTLSDL